MKKNILICFLAIVMLLVFASCNNDRKPERIKEVKIDSKNWLMFQNNKELSGATDATVCAEKLKLKWKKEIHIVWPRKSTPAIKDDIVYLSGYKKAYAMQLLDGKSVYELDLGVKNKYVGSVSGTPALVDGFSIFIKNDIPSDGWIGTVFCVDSNGKIRWSNSDISAAKGSIIFDDGLLYIGDLNGQISALNIADGRIMWKYDAVSGISHQVIIDKYIYSVNNDGIHCLNKKTGKLLWNNKESKVYFVIAHKKTIICYTEKGLKCLDSFGKLLWSYSENRDMSKCPAIKDDRLFICFEGDVYCFDANNGKVLWKNSLNDFQGRGFFSSLVATKSNIFAVTESGLLVAMKTGNGEIVARYGVGGCASSPAIIDNNVVLLMKKDDVLEETTGYVYCFQDNGDYIDQKKSTVIFGKVYDSQGNLLVNSKIVIADVKTTTNQNGEYEVNITKFGGGDIFVRATGGQSANKKGIDSLKGYWYGNNTIYVNAGENTQCDIKTKIIELDVD